jgi:hypothetical protein
MTFLLCPPRSEEYKRLKFSMERKTKKLEKKKETIGAVGESGVGAATAASKTTKRKIEREEERLKSTNRDLSMFRMKSMCGILEPVLLRHYLKLIFAGWPSALCSPPC